MYVCLHICRVVPCGVQVRKGDEKARELEELVEGSGHFEHFQKNQRYASYQKGGD